MAFTPKVSVVVPVYNAESCIEECIDSLLSLIYPKKSYDIIVVNNRSSDKTDSILQKFNNKIKILDEQKKGASAARNTGIKNSKGEIIVFTDADCRVDKQWLRNIVKPFEESKIGVVGGKILSIQPCNYIENFGDIINNNEAAINDKTLPSCISMNWASKLSVLNEVGMFDEDLLRSHDVDLSWRILKAGYSLRYEPNAIIYHKHINNLKDLFHKGFVHGFYGTKLLHKHEEYLNEKGIKRVYWSTYTNIFKSVIKILTANEKENAICYFTFNGSKKLGKILGSIRFNYLNI